MENMENIDSLSPLHQCLIAALMTPVKALNESLTDYAQRGGVMGLPLVLIGAPGIGKSAEIIQVSAALEMLHYTFPVDSLEIDDLSGVMVHVGNGELRRSTDNHKIQEIIEAGEGVLFVDEINTSRGLDPALNRLVYEREFCKKPLPPGVRVLAAMNPPALSAGGRPLRPSLANRLCHLEVRGHTLQQWGDFIQRRNSPVKFDSSSIRSSLEKNWERYREEAGMAALAYLHSKTENLHAPPKPETGGLSGAWASERTWHMAINVLATCKALGVGDTHAHTLIHGCLGPAVAGEWAAYRLKNNLPSTEDVLKGKWVPGVDIRSDIFYAVVSSVVNVAGRRKLTMEEAINLYKMGATQMENGNKDIFYPIVAALMRQRYGMGMATASGTSEEVKSLITKVLSSYSVVIYRNKDVQQ